MEKLVFVFITKWCAQTALKYIGTNIANNLVVQRKGKDKVLVEKKLEEDLVCIPLETFGEEDFLYLKRMPTPDKMIEDTLFQFITSFQKLQEENKDLKNKLEEREKLLFKLLHEKEERLQKHEKFIEEQLEIMSSIKNCIQKMKN